MRIKQNDLADWREENKPKNCPILRCELNDPVVDHDHKTGRIRGVIDRRANALIGKIENFNNCFLKLKPDELRNVLNKAVDWIEGDYSNMPYHPTAIKLFMTWFRKLKADEQRIELVAKGVKPAKNQKERVKQWRKVVIKEV